MSTELLIVDDHPIFVGGFLGMARTLRPAWGLRVARDAAETRAALARAPLPHVIVLDILLPDEDGFAVLRAIREAHPGVPVILMSAREDVGFRVRARAGGAAGFLSKTAAPAEVIGGIEAVLAGGDAFGAKSGPATIPSLTQRQAEVLALLAEGHGNKEIRYRLGIAERTVRAHLTTLFQLLDAYSRAQAVIRARELGLIS